MNATFYWMDLGNRAADGQVILGVPPINRKHRRMWGRLDRQKQGGTPLNSTAAEVTGRDCSTAIAAIVLGGGAWLLYELLTRGAR